ERARSLRLALVDRLEAVAAHDPRELLRLSGAAEMHVATDCGHVVELRVLLQVTRELAQRDVPRAAHLARPCDRRPAMPHRQNVLVPEVQDQDRIAGCELSAIAERERAVGLPDPRAEETARVGGELVDALPPAKPAVELQHPFEPREGRTALLRELGGHDGSSGGT